MVLKYVTPHFNLFNEFYKLSPMNITRHYFYIFLVILTPFTGFTEPENCIVTYNSIRLAVHSKNSVIDSTNKRIYSIKNIFDKEPSTIWIGKKTSQNKFAPDFCVEFSIPQMIDAIGIQNRKSTSRDIFSTSSRIKILKISFQFYDKTFAWHDKTVELQDTTSFQVFHFTTKALKNKINKINFYIEETYKGSISQDICLSRLNFKFNRSAINITRTINCFYRCLIL